MTLLAVGGSRGLEEMYFETLIHGDCTAGPSTTRAGVSDRPNVIGLHYDASRLRERWPALARADVKNDFASVRATVVRDWEQIDHADLRVDPSAVVELSDGD
ncbi:hypothetical protein [Haloarchaeobius sp. TZWWS8]|uniref:hypothetical protein n=1 Tax=Haloarchaeobius sp. TZWWS8 TaxID=3446121 RepID=UPI003EBDD2CF